MHDDLVFFLLGWIVGVAMCGMLALAIDERRKRNDAARRYVSPPGVRQHVPPRQADGQPQATTATATATVTIPEDSAPAQVQVLPVSGPAIVTRTMAAPGAALVDLFALNGERSWTTAEQQAAVKRYERGDTVHQIALAMRIDQKDVAAILVRVLLGATGVINDEASAPQSGMAYAAADLRRIRESCNEGISLRALAGELGRSQLGVGWKMLEMRVCPPSRCRTHSPQRMQ